MPVDKDDEAVRKKLGDIIVGYAFASPRNQDLKAAVDDAMQLIHAREERDWWITDVLPGGEHAKLLGPFTSSEDAAVARQYIELHRNDNRTFWIERLQSQLKENKEKE